MNYLIFALLAPIAVAGSDFVSKIVVTDDSIDSNVFAGFFGLLVSLLSLPAALILESLSITMFDWSVLLTLGVMTIMYTLAMSCYFRAMQSLPISELVFLQSLTPIWVLFSSALLFGEEVITSKVVGVILIVAALLVAFRFQGFSNWGQAHFLGLAASLFYAGGYLADKHLLSYLPTISYQVLSFGLPSLVLLVLSYKNLEQLRYFIEKPRSRNIVFSALLAGLSYLALFQAYRLSDEISLVSPVFETKSLWTVVLGVVFLKEKKNLVYKLVGVMLAIVGVVVIS